MSSMECVTHIYGFTESDMDALGKRLADALGLVFKSHDSSYVGWYLLDRSGRFSNCRLYFNRDPLWESDTDPAEEQYFEADAPDCELLLDLYATVDILTEANRVILGQFPTARRIKPER